ncbi:hypothetical protein BRADI_2g34925v3 [Brachypodium distachyon]|uniref:Uncharacterized protein n=1 Tax=Brachypodium distachyon TaxID=15368 RepID=A0A2K2DBV4_BRADI|nr:hypothetical protein BRADI_2g34925v3 [Brachypodium distachyon]
MCQLNGFNSLRAKPPRCALSPQLCVSALLPGPHFFYRMIVWPCCFACICMCQSLCVHVCCCARLPKAKEASWLAS